MSAIVQSAGGMIKIDGRECQAASLDQTIHAQEGWRVVFVGPGDAAIADLWPVRDAHVEVRAGRRVAAGTMRVWSRTESPDDTVRVELFGAPPAVSATEREPAGGAEPAGTP